MPRVAAVVAAEQGGGLGCRVDGSCAGAADLPDLAVAEAGEAPGRAVVVGEEQPGVGAGEQTAAEAHKIAHAATLEPVFGAVRGEREYTFGGAGENHVASSLEPARL